MSHSSLSRVTPTPLTGKWLDSLIRYKEERCKLAIITTIVIIVIGLGVACYFYEGGRYAMIPHYNQIFACSMWGVAAAITLGTMGVYACKHYRSTRKPEASQAVKKRQVKKFVPKRYSLSQMISRDKDMKRLTQHLDIKSIVELSEEEKENAPFKDLESDIWNNREPTGGGREAVLRAFEEKGTSFLAAPTRLHEWYILMRIEIGTPDAQDNIASWDTGVLLLWSTTISSSCTSWKWRVSRLLAPIREEVALECHETVIFGSKLWLGASEKSVGLKKVLEGGTLDLTFPGRDGDDNVRTIRLWRSPN